MTYLSYNGQLRAEVDNDTIANLLRKGWLVAPQPVYDSTTHACHWAEGSWVVDPITAQVPREVARWALRELCEDRGHEAEIEAALSKLPADVQRKARGRWASKDTISRGSSIISALQSILKWTDAYVDELFIEADKLSKS